MTKLIQILRLFPSKIVCEEQCFRIYLVHSVYLYAFESSNPNNLNFNFWSKNLLYPLFPISTPSLETQVCRVLTRMRIFHFRKRRRTFDSYLNSINTSRSC